MTSPAHLFPETATALHVATDDLYGRIPVKKRQVLLAIDACIERGQHAGAQLHFFSVWSATPRISSPPWPGAWI